MGHAAVSEADIPLSAMEIVDLPHLDEARDVHPILRGNPSLIEDGLKLLRGETFLAANELKRIDLLFEDRSRIPTFVEVKWNEVSEQQMIDYSRLLATFPTNYRLLWAVPEDLLERTAPAAKYGIEVKTFRRDKIHRIKGIQERARRQLETIKAILARPFKVTMHREAVIFENIIAACYFEGRAQTEKGAKKLGLKQQGVGRQLDLMRCLAVGHLPELHPEKIILLLWELFRAPYSYKPGRLFRISQGGFIDVIKERQERDLEKVILEIWAVIDAHRVEFLDELKAIWAGERTNYDLLAMLLSGLSTEQKKEVFTISDLIKLLGDEFELRPYPVAPRIKHGILNQWIRNIVSVKDYENDMAKRLLEVGVLKRILLARMGTVDMWVLVPSKITGKLLADRQPCQMLQFNRDSSLYLDITDYN